jgi:hypothetical protein
MIADPFRRGGPDDVNRILRGAEPNGLQFAKFDLVLSGEAPPGMSPCIDASKEINRDKSDPVFEPRRVFPRFGDLYFGVLHGRLDAGDGRRLVRMPRRSGLREDRRNDTVRRLVPAGVQRISVRLRDVLLRMGAQVGVSTRAAEARYQMKKRRVRKMQFVALIERRNVAARNFIKSDGDAL